MEKLQPMNYMKVIKQVSGEVEEPEYDVTREEDVSSVTREEDVSSVTREEDVSSVTR